MGTPEFAVAGLKNLVESGYTIAGVITAPDRPAGRGQKLRQSAVKEYAVSKNLTVLQPTNLKNPEFLAELEGLKANLQVVVAFRMLPEAVWKMPEYGTFNLHASLLPDYRGAAPINWAIIKGEKKTGVTTFFIDEKIDTGAIILQEEIPIEADESAGSLHDRLMELGSQLILKTVKLIGKGHVTTTAQPRQEQIHTAYKLTRENTRIDWEKPVDEVYNFIRGLSPYPTAWSVFTNEDDEEHMVKVYAAAKLLQEDIKKEEPGKITVANGALLVHLKDGILALEEIQLAGKRKMTSRELLNGFTFSEDAKMR